MPGVVAVMPVRTPLRRSWRRGAAADDRTSRSPWRRARSLVSGAPRTPLLPDTVRRRGWPHGTRKEAVPLRIDSIGVIGLGDTGSAVARRLLEQGFEVTVHDRDVWKMA